MKKEDFKVGISFRVDGKDTIYKVQPIIEGSKNIIICDADEEMIGFVEELNDTGVLVENVIMMQLVTFTLPLSKLELVTTNPKILISW